MLSKKLIESTKAHEGFRDEAYQDTVGVWTIGYGTNLQELRVSEEWASRKLLEDLEEAHLYASQFPEWEHLDTRARRDLFVELVYNMGPGRVAGFKNMLRAIRDEDWEDAADELLDSRWARQVKSTRAGRMSGQLRTGKYWNE